MIMGTVVHVCPKCGTSSEATTQPIHNRSMIVTGTCRRCHLKVESVVSIGDNNEIITQSLSYSIGPKTRSLLVFCLGILTGTVLTLVGCHMALYF